MHPTILTDDELNERADFARQYLNRFSERGRERLWTNWSRALRNGQDLIPRRPGKRPLTLIHGLLVLHECAPLGCGGRPSQQGLNPAEHFRPFGTNNLRNPVRNE